MFWKGFWLPCSGFSALFWISLAHLGFQIFCETFSLNTQQGSECTFGHVAKPCVVKILSPVLTTSFLNDAIWKFRKLLCVSIFKSASFRKLVVKTGEILLLSFPLLSLISFPIICYSNAGISISEKPQWQPVFLGCTKFMPSPDMYGLSVTVTNVMCSKLLNQLREI